MKAETISPKRSARPVEMLLGAPVEMLLAAPVEMLLSFPVDILLANAVEEIAKPKREAKSMFRRFFIVPSPSNMLLAG